MGDTLALHQSLGKVPVVRLRLYISVIAGASSSAALGNLKHFFLDCPIYIQVRTTLIGNINRATTCYTLDIELLTCGSDNLTYEQNFIIFKYVFDYIKCSKRFLIV